MGTKTKQGKLSDRMAQKRICFQGRMRDYTLNSLKTLAEAHGATVTEDIDAKTDYVVVPDPAAVGKGVAKTVLALNTKGATIQIIGQEDFAKQTQPTDEEVIRVIRQGQPAVDLFNQLINSGLIHAVYSQIKRRIVAESFAGCDLSHFNFPNTAFEGCDFTGATLDGSLFAFATRCTFDKVKAPNARLCDVSGSTFKSAMLQCAFCSDAISDVDFTDADLTQARFQVYGWNQTTTPWRSLTFRDANLTNAIIGVHLVQPDFEGANLSGVGADGLTIEAGNFRKANLSKATLNGCKFPRCDFSGADLRNTHLAEADLTGAVFAGADLTGCNLRGAKLDDVDLSKAKGYDPGKQVESVAGPAMLDLDNVISQSKWIRFRVELAEPILSSHCNPNTAKEITADTAGLQWGWAIRTPLSRPGAGQRKSAKFSDDLITAARSMSDVKIQFETLDVTAHKAPLKSAPLRDLVIRALCEAFSQEAPDAEKIEAVAKAKKARYREQAADARKHREAIKKHEEKLKKKESKQIEKKIAKAVGGKVTDIAGFLKALELRADVAKISKATKMLKAEKFQLFNDIADTHLQGVVKSQTDPDLVYACRIESDGQYACCTQNLNICGGLRGSICKHLLVLIIGLVKAGELDPSTIDEWVAKSRTTKAELNKETMGEIFIRYKGAEAGEVDWRPTETVPEDYYAL